MIELSINGKAYPCRQSMGAWLLFKENTGKEVTEIASGALSEVCILLWCCVKTASRRDGVPFDMDLETFADNVTIDVLQAWQEAVNKEGEAETEDINESDVKKK